MHHKLSKPINLLFRQLENILGEYQIKGTKENAKIQLQLTELFMEALKNLMKYIYNTKFSYTCVFFKFWNLLFCEMLNII